MKKISLSFILLLLSIFTYAQNALPSLSTIAMMDESGKVLYINADYQVSHEDFFSRYYTLFGLTDVKEMKIKNIAQTQSLVDTNTVTIHYHYQQYKDEFPIKGAIITLHERNGLVTKISGNFASISEQSTINLLTATQAIAIALENSSSQHFFWENPDLEADIKMIKNDTNATYYPEAKLMFFTPELLVTSNQYVLAYEVELRATEPLQSEIFYIDAHSGKIISSFVKKEEINVNVSAETRYSGTQTLTVDSLAPDTFILRSNPFQSGNGIVTKTMHNQGSMSNLPLSTASLIYENNSHFNSDIIANSAHYGSEVTYRYYMDKFGRNSIDNAGITMVNYVHLGNNISNAMWCGFSMYYGDGVNNEPFTFLSCCGHEITHGVTQFTADLFYNAESGALNESFSDMFGALIAHSANDTLDWVIGSEISNPFRDMSNPKAHNDPNTYQGQYWSTNSEDNYGVHTNNGVGNFWFYLLTDGGSGINDHQYAYNLPGLGPDRSAQIIYHLLTGYLSSYSNYHDAYFYSLQVANDLFGDCSNETKIVANTWAAVGIGHSMNDSILFVEDIINPSSDCEQSSQEEIIVSLFYNDCDNDLPSGTPLCFKIIFNDEAPLFDTLYLSQTITAGDYFQVSLHPTLNLSNGDQHYLSIYVAPYYQNLYTDSITHFHIEKYPFQNSDIGVAEIVAPQSSCHLNNSTPIAAKIIFNGCTQKEIGDSIKVSYSINNQQYTTETIILTTSFSKGDTLLYTFNTPADFTQTAKNVVRVFTENEDDMNENNNLSSKIVTLPITLNTASLPFDFTAAGYSNYYYTDLSEFGSAFVGSITGYNGGRTLRMSGGDPNDYYPEFEYPTSPNDDLWELNKFLDANVTFCIDAANMQTLSVQFDMQQTSGEDAYLMFFPYRFPEGFDFSNTSMMRLLVNNTPITETFTPTTSSEDPFINHSIVLTPYVGDMIELTFQSKCIGRTFSNFQLDFVNIDNINLSINNEIGQFATANFTAIPYPNPNNGNFGIDFLSTSPSSYAFDLYDIRGTKVYSEILNLATGKQHFDFQLSHLTQGLYIGKIGESTFKIIVKK